MHFTICNDNIVFPYLIVDDLYTEEEQDLIWSELELLQPLYKMDTAAIIGGSSLEPDGTPSAKLKRLYLDSYYGTNREKSNIFKFYNKITSLEIQHQYGLTTPSWGSYSLANTDKSIISYYDNGDEYKEHFDTSMHTCLVWFYREPKRFTGGDLYFSQSDSVVECKHNRMVLFPGYYMHQVNTLNIAEEYANKGLGRYCITHMYTVNQTV
jgi:hypothetical protein